MKKIILIPLLFLFTFQFNAQEMELLVGRNFTTYDYTNSDGESNPNLEGASGSYIEVSYNVPLIVQTAYQLVLLPLLIHQF